MNGVLFMFAALIGLGVISLQVEGMSRKANFLLFLSVLWIPLLFVLAGYSPIDDAGRKEVGRLAVEEWKQDNLNNETYQEAFALCWLVLSSTDLPESDVVSGWIDRNYGYDFDKCMGDGPTWSDVKSGWGT